MSGGYLIPGWMATDLERVARGERPLGPPPEPCYHPHWRIEFRDTVVCLDCECALRCEHSASPDWKACGAYATSLWWRREGARTQEATYLCEAHGKAEYEREGTP